MESGVTGDGREAETEDASVPVDAIIQENKILRENNLYLQHQVSVLRDELQQLRNVIVSNDGNEVSVPRKMPRANVSAGSSPSISNENVKNISSSSATADVNINGADNAVGNAAQVNKQRKKVLQAISVNISEINKQLKNNNCVNYTVKQTNKNAPVKISITNTEDIPKIKKLLHEARVGFHEFMWDSEKKKTFIIKGLVGATNEDLAFIKNHLILAGLPKEIDVSFFKSGYMRANPRQEHNTLIKLVLPPNADTQVLNDIKYIDHVVVKIEPIKNNKILQCKNCQRFGHSASGCQHVHRCVKCGANHLRDDCPRTSDKSIRLKCCNCGGEHTANNVKECPFAQKVLNNSHFGNLEANNINKNGGMHRSSGNLYMNRNATNANNVNVRGIIKNGSNGFSDVCASGSASSSNSGLSNNKQIRFNNDIDHSSPKTHTFSYAQVLSGRPRYSSDERNDHGEIVGKLDFLIDLVLKHERLFAKLSRHG